MCKKNKLLSFVLMISLAALSIFGCAQKTIIADKAIIRYQIVKIPSYEKLDYERLITSDNDEVKYNAICNLIPYAPTYATILEKCAPDETSQGTTLKDVVEYKNAKKVFGMISEELSSQNKSIQAASLIFITHFSSDYSNKDQLLKLVLDVKTKEVRTQYEQIYALIKLSDSDTVIEKNLIENLLDTQSWLIKSMAYLLIGKMTSDDYHERLIKEYTNIHEEYDKILILSAFNKGYGPEVFSLIKHELLSENNEKFKQQIIKTLKGHKNNKAVVEWLINDHNAIGDKLLIAILNEYYSEMTSQSGAFFFRKILLSNQEQIIALMDKEKFFHALDNGINNEDSQNNLVKLEISVQKNEYLNKAWITYQHRREKERLAQVDREKREDEFTKNILPKYNVMLEKFFEDSKKMFADSGMNQDEIEESIKGIRELLKYLSEKDSQ